MNAPSPKAGNATVPEQEDEIKLNVPQLALELFILLVFGASIYQNYAELL